MAALVTGLAPASARPPIPQRPDPDALYVVPVGDSYVRGSRDAVVTIVEFSDYQCPFCVRVESTINEVLETFEGRVRLVIKHHPLPFHREARLASIAALAAGDQDRFWDYHAVLMTNHRHLTRPDLERYARQLQLNMKKFLAALDKPERHEKQIGRDQALAERVGARGIPTFFINGMPLVGAQPLEIFTQIIDAELEG